MAVIRSRPASDFSMNPRAPALSAWPIRSSDSCMVRTSTCVSGLAFRIRRNASRPFNSGMMMSRSTMSGLSFLVFSTVSRPVAASPQISHPGWVSSSARKPWRTTS